MAITRSAISPKRSISAHPVLPRKKPSSFCKKTINKYGIRRSLINELNNTTGNALPPKTSKGERLSYFALQAKFPNVKLLLHQRPNWLKNNLTGRNLELDIITSEPIDNQIVALEYNGRQHYEISFGMSLWDFQQQQYRDELKKQLCAKHNMKLIIIPYTCKNIEQEITNQLKSVI